MDVRTLNSIVQGIGQGITGNQRLGQEERRLKMAERMSALDEQLKRGEIDVQTALNSFHKAQAQYGEKALPYEHEAKTATAKQRVAESQRALDMYRYEDEVGVPKTEVLNRAAQAKLNAGALRMGGTEQAQKSNAIEYRPIGQELVIKARRPDAALPDILAGSEAAAVMGDTAQAEELTKKATVAADADYNERMRAAAEILLPAMTQGPGAWDAAAAEAEGIVGPAIAVPGKSKFVSDGKGGLVFVYVRATDGKTRTITPEAMQRQIETVDLRGRAIPNALVTGQWRREAQNVLNATKEKQVAALEAYRRSRRDDAARRTLIGAFNTLYATSARDLTSPDAAEAVRQTLSGLLQDELEAAGIETPSALPRGTQTAPPPAPGRAAALGAGTIFDPNHTPQ